MLTYQCYLKLSLLLLMPVIWRSYFSLGNIKPLYRKTLLLDLMPSNLTTIVDREIEVLSPKPNAIWVTEHFQASHHVTSSYKVFSIYFKFPNPTWETICLYKMGWNSSKFKLTKQKQRPWFYNWGKDFSKTEAIFWFHAKTHSYPAHTGNKT